MCVWKVMCCLCSEQIALLKGLVCCGACSYSSVGNCAVCLPAPLENGLLEGLVCCGACSYSSVGNCTVCVKDWVTLNGSSCTAGFEVALLGNPRVELGRAVRTCSQVVRFVEDYVMQCILTKRRHVSVRHRCQHKRKKQQLPRHTAVKSCTSGFHHLTRCKGLNDPGKPW